MTVEAALTKLSYLLGQPNLTVKTIREVYIRAHSNTIASLISTFAVDGREHVWRINSANTGSFISM